MCWWYLNVDEEPTKRQCWDKFIILYSIVFVTGFIIQFLYFIPNYAPLKSFIITFLAKLTDYYLKT